MIKYVFDTMNLCCIKIFVFLENFQKLPSGLFVAARRHMHVSLFWVLEEEPPGGKLPIAKRRITDLPIFWKFYDRRESQL